MDAWEHELGRIRDRIRDVLAPHIGSNRATERANNICQALLHESEDDAAAVAFDMLDRLNLEDTWPLAWRIAEIWEKGSPRLSEENCLSSQIVVHGSGSSERRASSGVQRVDTPRPQGAGSDSAKKRKRSANT